MGLRRKRRFFTAAESAEIWDRLRRGEGLKSIASMSSLDLADSHSSVRAMTAAAATAAFATTGALFAAADELILILWEP